MSKTKRIRSVATADLRTALKDPAQLLLIFVLPLLALLILSQVTGFFLLEAGDAVETSTSGNMLMPVALTASLMLCAFVRLVTTLSHDVSSGTISRYAMTSLRLHEFFLARTISNAIFFSIQATFLAAVAYVLGWQPQFTWHIAAGLALGVLAFTSFAFVITGLTKGSAAALAFAYGFFFIAILCGVLIARDAFPSSAQVFLEALPTTALVELSSKGFLYRLPPQWAWISLGAWAAVTPVAAMKVFRWK